MMPISIRSKSDTTYDKPTMFECAICNKLDDKINMCVFNIMGTYCAFCSEHCLSTWVFKDLK